MSANVLELIVHMRAGRGPTVNPAFTAAINAYKNSSFITFWENAIADAPRISATPDSGVINQDAFSEVTLPSEPATGRDVKSDLLDLREKFPALFNWNPESAADPSFVPAGAPGDDPSPAELDELLIARLESEKYTAAIQRWQNEIFAKGDMSGFAMHASFARAFTNKSLQMMTELEDSKLVIADTYSAAFKNKGDVLSKGIPSLTSNSAALAADLARYGTYGSGIHMREWHTLRGVLQELDYREMLPYLNLTGIDLSTATDTEIAARFNRVTAEQLRTVKQVFDMDASVELRNLADLTRATHVFATSNSSNTFSTLQEFAESLAAIGNFDGVKHWSALAEYIASVEIVVDSSPTLSDPATEAGITSIYGFGTGVLNSVTTEDLFGILTGEKYILIMSLLTSALLTIDTSGVESAINDVIAAAESIDLEDEATIDEYKIKLQYAKDQVEQLATLYTAVTVYATPTIVQQSQDVTPVSYSSSMLDSLDIGVSNELRELRDIMSRLPAELRSVLGLDFYGLAEPETVQKLELGDLISVNVQDLVELINTLINVERACVEQAEIDLTLYTLNPNNRDLIVGFAESLPNLQPDSDVFVFLQKLADPATPAGRVYANTLNEAVVTQAQRENNVR